MNHEDPGVREAVDAVSRVNKMGAEEGRNYLEMLGCASVHFMRAKFGDEYIRGWLESALRDLEGPALLELRKLQ